MLILSIIFALQLSATRLTGALHIVRPEDEEPLPSPRRPCPDSPSRLPLRAPPTPNTAAPAYRPSSPAPLQFGRARTPRQLEEGSVLAPPGRKLVRTFRLVIF